MRSSAVRRLLAGARPLSALVLALLALGGPAAAQHPAAGWIEGGRPGCRVWNPEPLPGESAVWSGACANGFAHGYGTLLWLQHRQQTDRFVGEYRDGKRTGRGTYAWFGGERYEGEYRDDRRTGRGVYTWPNGSRYQGGFRDGHLHGQGIMTWADGSRYEGEWLDSRAHGRGTKVEADGSVFAGHWARGCFRDADRPAQAGASRDDCGVR